MISKRLNPHSFVFALNPKIARDVWNDYHTELLLSALSLRLNYDRIHAKGQAAVPVYRKRFNELADLPISFKKTGIHSVGHTGRIGMMTWEPKQLTHEDIKELVDSSPKILNAIFNYKNEGSNDDRNNLLSYIRVFDNINTGAFIASELTVIEQLLIDNGNWKELKSKVEFLFKNKQSDITQLFKERHEYIHQGLLPDNDAMTLFGFEVLTFVLMKKLQFYDSFPNVSFKKYIDGDWISR